MTCRNLLLHRLIPIELYNIKNICPIVYKIEGDTFSTPLQKYNITIDNHVILTDKHNYNIKSSPMTLNNLYFINGFNKHVSLLSHIEQKYKYNSVRCDENKKCNHCIERREVMPEVTLVV
jgi:hypothetical protein